MYVNTQDMWAFERIYESGEEFLKAVVKAVEEARLSVDIEMYIFNLDETGEELLAALRRAADRSVQVRVLVDGIGTPDWIAHPKLEVVQGHFKFRIFHPAPWPYSRFLLSEFLRFGRWWSTIVRLNARDHKKMVIVDGQRAFAGSANFWNQSKKWRELGVEVHGLELELLNYSFEINWRRGFHSRRRFRDRFIRISRPRLRSNNVLLNYPWAVRLWRNQTVLERIERAQQRIWIETPYFVPRTRLLRQLCRAAFRGVDVRIILPERSDHIFIDWLQPVMLRPLLRSGAKVYCYNKTFLHAKFMQVDDWSVVGSSNLNHRSAVSDLELDIVVSRPESQQHLRRIFEGDLASSVTVDRDYLRRRPFWQKWVARVLFWARAWL